MRCCKESTVVQAHDQACQSFVLVDLPEMDRRRLVAVTFASDKTYHVILGNAQPIESMAILHQDCSVVVFYREAA